MAFCSSKVLDLHHVCNNSVAMADVRALLAAERASRRITHPNAAYTADGKLRCNLCEQIIKSDAAWQAHLHSTTHTLRVSRESESASRGPSKKRKALDSSPDASDERKRAKPDENEGRREVLADPPAGMEDESEKLAGLAAMARGNNAPAPVATPRVAQEFGLPEPTEVGSQSLEAAQVQSLSTAQDQLLGRTYDDGGTTAQKASGDDDELAAFERELAELEERNRVATRNAEATISAAPMTAEEIAAQAREEQSAQRGRRDVEYEDERDEAASALADEFDEMDGLEARLKRLRERREALRDAKAKPNDRGKRNDGAVAVNVDASQPLQVGTGKFVDSDATPTHEKEVQALTLDGDEDSESGDEGWGFGHG
ncbi:hypothetical protein LTR56_010796 [Elasticomyces elasticus]|nr:hypothetical protein LTR56_010796 [Elasticomyces elasticus]KAK3667821.1 hypothetical protein LTR22_001266 [Elasticomyces elasticus]KAK5763434.1 hypothetical protein LTS12_006405 [Elasticomyces elasticus]